MGHDLVGGSSHPVVITGIDTSRTKVKGGAPRPVFWTGVTQDVLDTLGALLSIASNTGYVSITIENPGAAEDINMGFFERAITLVEMNAVVVGSGSPSMTIDPYHTLDRSVIGTDILAAPLAIINETTGQNVSSFADPTIPADSWFILETTALGGTVTELTVTFKFTYD